MIAIEQPDAISLHNPGRGFQAEEHGIEQNQPDNEIFKGGFFDNSLSKFFHKMGKLKNNGWFQNSQRATVAIRRVIFKGLPAGI